MFDTMTLTKATGALCGAFLVFLLGGWAAEEIYHHKVSHDGEHAQAYTIDTGEEEATDEAEDEGPAFMDMMASAEMVAGESVFQRRCTACHKVEDGENGAGPHLYGVVGRAVGAVDGFSYSGALKEVAETWTPEELNGFLEDPRGYAPGTSMGFNGLPKIEDRANLITYLQSIGG